MRKKGSRWCHQSMVEDLQAYLTFMFGILLKLTCPATLTHYPHLLTSPVNLTCEPHPLTSPVNLTH